MTGTLVAVVGPSGAGKDTLIDFARARLQSNDRIGFVRRIVTRPCHGGSEDHDSMDEKAFVRAEAAGGFALSWAAHGLRYGLPISLDADLEGGRIAVANLSRQVIPALMERYPTALVVSVTANRDVIARRLANRGRETRESIQQRLDRSVESSLPASTISIDNSGSLEVAGMQFTNLLLDMARMVERN
ncbi:MAG TPA: phosphonate metabolism protein/1,5-bisphosphokinase (PRPP-forming) PhnN [Devosia sp.]|jgi:ribose 1,5-bisphosphokinase|nr:phosphonate metabolism protein/1,5-bisphosphokinase (PRPP-forming) PhnN [Devosia sp.]